MEKRKGLTPTVGIVHKQDTFKIVIPEKVEKKIRFLCKNICDVEWSGVLFYEIEGTFEDKSLVIKCVDLFQMDIGTSAYTEFTPSPDIANYIIDHPELLKEGVYQGLIHSHNNMPTFFSTTDICTLEEEGNDMAHFVSLIVNNAGRYTAGITRKYKCTKTVSEEYTYFTWNNEEREGIREFNTEEEELEWFDLDVIFEGVDNNFEEEIMNRIDEIRKSKRPVTLLQTLNYGKNVALTRKGKDIFPMNEDRYYKGYEGLPELKYGNTGEAQSFSNQFEEDLDPNIPYGVVTVNSNIVQSIIKQLVTSSIIISNESAVDIKKWAGSMDSLYKKRFGDTEDFKYFAANYLDYLITHTYDENVMEEIDNDDASMAALLAYDVREELKKLPNNPWLNVYIELINDYII